MWLTVSATINNKISHNQRQSNWIRATRLFIEWTILVQPFRSKLIRDPCQLSDQIKSKVRLEFHPIWMNIDWPWNHWYWTWTMDNGHAILCLFISLLWRWLSLSYCLPHSLRTIYVLSLETKRFNIWYSDILQFDMLKTVQSLPDITIPQAHSILSS